jgi:RES domain-containing protein
MRVWRISNHAELSSRGGLVTAGRWHRAQTQIVYCADHPASAMLEILVHVDFEDRPESFQLLSIDIPHERDIATAIVPAGWKDDIEITRGIGSGFVADAKSAVLAVPSVIVPHGTNYLLSPSLLEAAGIHIASAETHSFDSRLLGAR